MLTLATPARVGLTATYALGTVTFPLMLYDANENPEVNRHGVRTEAIATIGPKKQLMRRREDVHVPPKYFCYKSPLLHIKFPS